MEYKIHPNTAKGLEDVRDVFGGAFNKAKEQYGEIRKAGAILSANPVGMIISELVFPKGVADGTLSGALNRNGYSAINTEPARHYDPTL